MCPEEEFFEPPTEQQLPANEFTELHPHQHKAHMARDFIGPPLYRVTGDIELVEEVVVRKKQPKDFSIDELMSHSLPVLYIKANIDDDFDKGTYFIKWKKMLEKERGRLRDAEHFEEAQRIQEKITELNFDYHDISQPEKGSGIKHLRTHKQIAYSMLEPRLMGLSPWSPQEIIAEQYQKLNELKNKIESAVIAGELKAIVEIRQPGYDDGYKEITDPNRIRKIQGGYLAENYNPLKVRIKIHRDDFQAWQEQSGQWPLAEGCALAQWFETEPQSIALVDNNGALQNDIKQKSAIKKFEISPIFSQFENLRSNEISIVMMENQKAKLFIRKRIIEINPGEIGLNAGQQGWKLLEGAAVNNGDLTESLRRLNKTSNLEAEKGKIKKAVCELRKRLKSSMGLVDDPITYQKNNGYRFAFKLMTHEELNDARITKGGDAFNYVSREVKDCDKSYAPNFEEDYENEQDLESDY